MSAEPTHNQISLLNILLSSSVVLGAATGIFYLVGGAQYEGYSSAVLGMNLLGGLQPSEYIFSGAELLLFTSAIGLSLLLLPVVLLAAASISGAAGFLAAPLRT